MRIRVTFTGRSYQDAESLPDELSLPDSATLDDAISKLAEQLPGGEPLPPTCLVAVSGSHLGTVASHEARALTDGDELVLIAPVAGG